MAENPKNPSIPKIHKVFHIAKEGLSRYIRRVLGLVAGRKQTALYSLLFLGEGFEERRPWLKVSWD